MLSTISDDGACGLNRTNVAMAIQNSEHDYLRTIAKSAVLSEVVRRQTP